jgi:hypothetical protein
MEVMQPMEAQVEEQDTVGQINRITQHPQEQALMDKEILAVLIIQLQYQVNPR